MKWIGVVLTLIIIGIILPSSSFACHNPWTKDRVGCKSVSREGKRRACFLCKGVGGRGGFDNGRGGPGYYGPSGAIPKRINPGLPASVERAIRRR